MTRPRKRTAGAVRDTVERRTLKGCRAVEVQDVVRGSSTAQPSALDRNQARGGGWSCPGSVRLVDRERTLGAGRSALLARESATGQDGAPPRGSHVRHHTGSSVQQPRRRERLGAEAGAAESVPHGAALRLRARGLPLAGADRGLGAPRGPLEESRCRAVPGHALCRPYAADVAAVVAVERCDPWVTGMAAGPHLPGARM